AIVKLCLPTCNPVDAGSLSTSTNALPVSARGKVPNAVVPSLTVTVPLAAPTPAFPFCGRSEIRGCAVRRLASIEPHAVPHLALTLAACAACPGLRPCARDHWRRVRADEH